MSGSSSPLVSVGVPVWNGMPYLERALESLCDQDFGDYEIVVCDNASTDGTADYVRGLADREPDLRYVRNDTNIGGTQNFNRVFHLARGKYFKWAGADDFVSRGVLSRCVKALEQNPSVVLAFPDTVLVDEAGERVERHDEGSGWRHPRPSDRFEFSLTRWGLCNLLYGVVRSDVLSETILLRDYPGSDLVLQADLATRGRFHQVKGEILYRRVHSGATGGLDEASLARFYVPERDESFDMQFLRMFRDLLALAGTADVEWTEKYRMLRALARHAFWARRRLGGEAIALGRRLASRASGGGSGEPA